MQYSLHWKIIIQISFFDLRNLYTQKTHYASYST